jgi:predicted acetyltransferase
LIPATGEQQPAAGAQAGSAPPVVHAAGEAEDLAARALQERAFGTPGNPDLPLPVRAIERRVVVDGELGVLSCLTLLQAEVWVRGARLSMGGIRHVATAPEYQNRGYAGLLLRETLRSLRREGVCASILFPFSFRYYRKFGYELGGNQCHLWCRPGSLPAFAERKTVRPLRPEDAPALAALSARRGERSACTLARDAARWSALLAAPGLRAEGAVAPGSAGQGALEGYAVLSEGRDAYGGRVLKVLDLAATTLHAWRALTGRLSQAGTDTVEWYASAGDLAASGLLRTTAPLREGFKPRVVATVRPLFQFRLVNLAAALRARLAVFPPGKYSLALQATDDLLPENQAVPAIAATGSGVTVRAARPGDPVLCADIRVLSQLYCGFMAPGEAISQGMARVSSPRAAEIADQLFPAGDPFIPELDRF